MGEVFQPLSSEGLDIVGRDGINGGGSLKLVAAAFGFFSFAQNGHVLMLFHDAGVVSL